MPASTPQRLGTVRVGTSGWRYSRWRGDFYPAGLAQKRELAYIGERLPTLEINGTFYSLTTPAACTAWRQLVPRDFVFAIKGSRYITHMLKLRKFDAPLANFCASGILRLGATLGPILWQLPPQLPFDRERVLRLFGAVPRDVAAAERWARRHDGRTTGRAALRAPDGRDRAIRHAIEIRHPSWLEDDALETLRALDLALVAADAAGRYPLCFERTANFAYVRLHGSATLYVSRYEDDEIAAWAERIVGWTADGSDVYVYFDNDGEGHAPYDAVRLQAAVAAATAVSRVRKQRRRAPRMAELGAAHSECLHAAPTAAAKIG
jgi:uncharacterized protein YecE (DUF72 family)